MDGRRQQAQLFNSVKILERICLATLAVAKLCADQLGLPAQKKVVYAIPRGRHLTHDDSASTQDLEHRCSCSLTSHIFAETVYTFANTLVNDVLSLNKGPLLCTLFLFDP